MQATSVLPTLARSTAPRFGASPVPVPKQLGFRVRPCAARLAARRFIENRRRPTVTTAASRSLNEFPVADRRAELSKMTMAQLKPLCKGSGLKQGGKKGELVDRLLENEFGTTDDEADIDPSEDIVGLATEWRRGRATGAGVSFTEMDTIERAMKNSGFVDERGADAAFSSQQGFEDGGYSRSSEARGDQNVNQSSAAARLMGRDGGGFDDGAGAGWGDDDGWDRDAGYDGRYDDTQKEPQFTPEELAAQISEAKRKAALKAERSLERRAAIVTALRTLATEREGFESDPRVHLTAVSKAIEKSYREMRYSAFSKMDDRSREVCVDINVATGTLAILAQCIGRSGTVEWEVDDTEAFLEAHSKRHQIRKLAFAFTEEINEAVSAASAQSYVTREGEMIVGEVVAEGRGGEILLKLNDGAFACLPAEEAIPDKRYTQGDLVSALVVGVEPRTWAADKRAPVIVSCAIAGLLAEVFKAEVPEVARGDVVIKSVARVSGKMSKVAVALREGADASFPDPVLACVGVENARMMAIRERMGGEAVQVLPWRSNPNDFVAEALFPAVVKDVEQSDEKGSLDERGNPRRMSKFVAYVGRFDEAKAIGAGGLNVKLAAALCGCFIMVERFEDGGFGQSTNSSYDSRGGDTRWGDEFETEKNRWDEEDDWRDDRGDRAGTLNIQTTGIDLEDDGLDELGWPDLESSDVGGMGNQSGDSERFVADAEAKADSQLFSDPRDEDNWEEVGPGKVGVVTFGGNLGAGITGGCSFMGDPEEIEAERLGDAAESALASGDKISGNDEINLSFLDDDEAFDEIDNDDLFASDDLFGEEWNQ